MDYIAKFIERWFSRRDSEALIDAGLLDAGRFHCRKPLRRSIAELLVNLPSLRVFQFHDIKPDAVTLEHLNEILFKNRKDVTLRVYGYGDSWENIDFLRSLPEVERFDWDGQILGSPAPLYELSRLVGLGLGLTQPTPKISVEFLADFAETLEILNLQGDYKQLRQTVSKLNRLRTIWFSSTKLDDLDFLGGLAIHTFGNYGGRVRSFEFLRNIPTIKHLWLKTNATLENIDFVEDLINLELLELSYLAKIRYIPNLDNHTKLRQVSALECNRLTDVSALTKLSSQVQVAASGNALKNPFRTEGFRIDSSIYFD